MRPALPADLRADVDAGNVVEAGAYARLFITAMAQQLPENDFVEATGLSDACAETDCEEVGSIDKVAVRSTDDLALEAPRGESRRTET